jgi:hypothetical protein
VRLQITHPFSHPFPPLVTLKLSVGLTYGMLAPV